MWLDYESDDGDDKVEDRKSIQLGALLKEEVTQHRSEEVCLQPPIPCFSKFKVQVCFRT